MIQILKITDLTSKRQILWKIEEYVKNLYLYCA